MTVVCDTGVVYAALDRTDTNHARCAAFLEELDEIIVVPAPVTPEVDWLARSRGAPRATPAFLGSVIDSSVRVHDLDLGDYERVTDLLAQYADLGLRFVDASVAAVAERLGETRIATLDHRHFSVIRPRHTRSFELLP